ncbi:Methyltryptophan resistance [Hyphodiscus hymeniophilus]|uniref:Methyltryptophan resistance n=1 Tax=Hyphodiscus hymeniophilus TaxID=353542 RepID=A0A9P7AYK9_9HELO|nr:Methyltryptophan resistance [Hyphodiscus hymeniophilus]
MTSRYDHAQAPASMRDEVKVLALAEPVSTQNSESSQSQTIPEQKEEKLRDPFDEADDASVSCGDIKFKSLKWWQCGMIMIAETVSLGILSLPSVLATVGLVPGFILIVAMGILASYSGYTIGQFKQRYPNVQSMADAFEILCTPLGCPRFGKEFGGAAQTLFLVFSMGSHILTWVICFNAVTDDAVCNIVWGVIALCVFWLFDLPRTLKNMSHLAIISFFSIVIAVIITMIAVGIQEPGTGSNHYTLWPPANKPVAFWKAFLSVTNIVFAYAGHVAFFGFISELKDPKDFPKALALLQVCDVTMYIIVAVVVYRYGGIDVASPALGAAGPLVKKIAFGIAIPTIVIAGVIYGHVAAKYVYIRIYGAKALAKKTWRASLRWAAITGLLWIVAFIIAESIPSFNDLLGVVSSLFASWFTYGVSGIFWLFINKGKWFITRSKAFLTLVNWLIIVLATTICGVGLYASGMAINENSGQGGAWSCNS